jgi:hypothetical protein
MNRRSVDLEALARRRDVLGNNARRRLNTHPQHGRPTKDAGRRGHRDVVHTACLRRQTRVNERQANVPGGGKYGAQTGTMMRSRWFLI